MRRARRHTPFLSARGEQNRTPLAQLHRSALDGSTFVLGGGKRDAVGFPRPSRCGTNGNTTRLHAIDAVQFRLAGSCSRLAPGKASFNMHQDFLGRATPNAAGRWGGSIITAALVIAYLSILISFGSGFGVGDGGFWLVSQRDGIEKFPHLPGSMTPLTDVIGGMWLRFTHSLGLYGARLGWVLVNGIAAALVFAALTLWFPVGRVATAVLLSTPLICHQQFTVLEYTNIPWFLLLLFGLAYLRSQDPALGARKAVAFATLAGTALGAAALSRLPMFPALALPVCMWLLGLGNHRDNRALTTCTLVATAVVVVGLWWMWTQGSLAEMLTAFHASQSIGQAGQSKQSSYSLLGLAVVYVANLVIGIEQLSVVLVTLCAWLAARVMIARFLGPRYSSLAVLAIGFVIVFSVAAAAAARGTFNPRFQSGLPFIAIAICGTVCVSPPAFPSLQKQNAVRQLCFMAVAIPPLVMCGSNLGFFRMISAGWLTFPLAIVLIPDVAGVIDRAAQRIAPDAGAALHGASRIFLYGVVAVLVAYGTTYCWMHGNEDGSYLHMGARICHPRLRWIREKSDTAADIEGVLRTVESLVSPGETILAYPHLEMLYFITRTRSPFSHMFVHENERVLTEALEREPPRCVVYRETPTNSLWHTSESRRRLLDRFLVEHEYEKVWSNATFSVFTLPATLDPR